MGLLGYLVAVLVLLAILVLWETRWRDQSKNRTLQIAVTVILATLVAPAVFSLWSGWFSREERKREKEFRNGVLAFLEENQTDAQALQALIQLKYEAIFQSTEAEAVEWSREFLSSLPERTGKLQEIEKTGEGLARRLQEKWRPIYDFTLASLDERIAALSSSTAVTMTAKNLDQILVTKHPRKMQHVRVVDFPGGARLIVDADQGLLDRGVFARAPQLIFREFRNGNEDIVFSLRFQPELVRLSVGGNVHSAALEWATLEGDLMSDQNRETLVAAINYTIEFLFE